MPLEAKIFRPFVALCCILMITSCTLRPAGTEEVAAPTSQPNIILIYTDQQRADTIGALGNDIIETPTIDGLVRDGTAFTNAFVTAPVCAPSRWSLQSGLYTSQHRTYSNHHLGPRPETNLALLLKEAGYRTLLAGKNHTFLDERDLDVIIPTPRYDNTAEDWRTAEAPAPWTPAEDPMTRLTDLALDAIGGPDGQPFFLWLSYYYPHDPFQVPEPYFSMYDDAVLPEPVGSGLDLEAARKPFRQIFHKTNNDLLLPYSEEKRDRMRRSYYGMISLIDDQIGRFLTELDERGVLDNAIVMFTSDHGDYMGDYGLYTKSPAMQDSLIRVPLIVKGAGFAPGAVSDAPVSNIDILPTLLQAASVDPARAFPGTSLLSSERPDFVVAEYGLPGEPITSFGEVRQHYPDFPSAPLTYTPDYPWEANPVSLAGRFRMIRTRDWKLVANPGGQSELYDMRNDPGELVNLYGEEETAEIQAELEHLLTEWKNDHVPPEVDTGLSLRNIERYSKFREEGRDPRDLYTFNPSTTY